MCFLCSHLFTGVFLGGCGCVGVFSGKQGCKLRGSKHAVGFTFNTVERLARMLPPLFWCALLFCGVCGVGGVCGGLFVICIVVVSIFCFLVVWFCLVLLGIRWMPWHQELMKDVAACDMPRGAGERALLSEGVRMGEPNLGCAGLPSSERV